MTTSLQTNKHEKARAFSAGFEMIGRFNAATRQGLAGDATLTSLYDLNQQLGIKNKLLHLDSNITITSGFDTGTIAPTAGTIGLVLSNNLDEPVSLASVTPNSNQKPLIIDRVQPSALIIGPLNGTRALIAVDNLDDAVMLAQCLIKDNVTILASLDSLLFNGMVKHFSEVAPVTIFTTIDKKDKVCKPLAGANVKAVITVFDVLLQLDNHSTYADILADSDTTILDLQAEIWGEPEPLATNPSQPTPFPIHAFKGVLRASVEAISYHTQTPMAMAGFCSLGALAHIGQRFITAPMGYNSMPTSLFFIIEGDSGSGKSQAMGLSHFKIREHERQLYEDYLSDLEQWENNKASQKGKDIADFLASTPKPQNPMTLFDDATIEPILDRFINGEMSNASWTTDEAGQFFNGHTMQGDTAGNALSALTKLWSDGHVSRVRSQKNQYANVRTQAYDVRMTLLLMGQRIILETALTDEMMNQQGFLARALIACPESLQGTRIWNDEQRRKIDPYNDPAMIAYWSRCQSLLDPCPANMPETPQGAPNRIPMKWANSEAENTFYKHMQDIENRQAVGKHLEYLKAYASRMSENASRIAALMAFFDGRMTITIDDITRAFMLVEYSTAERLRYIDATPTGEENDSEKLSRWLVAHCQAQAVGKVAYATVQSRVNPKRLRKKIVLEVVIEELIAKKYIRVVSNDGIRFIHINPTLLTQ